MTSGATGDPRPAADPRASGASAAPMPAPPGESCDWCGSADTWWRNCKLLCRGCGAIVKSCADL